MVTAASRQATGFRLQASGYKAESNRLSNLRNFLSSVFSWGWYSAIFDKPSKLDWRGAERAVIGVQWPVSSDRRPHLLIRN
jgi:hypothetical protein